MDASLSTFDRNYALFMERFPKLALLLSISSSIEKETLEPIELKEVDLLYFYGIGRGEAYPWVKKWLHEKPKRRLIFLADDFFPFLEDELAEEILSDPQVVFDFPSEIDTLTEKFPLNQIEVLSLPSLRGKKFLSLRLNLLRKTTLTHALHMDRLHGYQPFMNFMQNVRRLPQSFYANGLKGRFSGVPAVVCGAGPSLEKSIGHLKKIEEKGLIIAGGSTLAALSSKGITPHFGMAIDPNLEEFRRLKNSFAFEVPFLYSTRVVPSAFQTCNGPFGYMRSGIGGLLELWMEEELGLIEPFIGENLSSESISVTTVCLAWAQFLGCNPIVLTGVDLAYTDKRHYAEGVTHERRVELGIGKEAAHRIMQKKDRKGKPIFTAVRWVMESASLTHFAKKHPEVAFINATEGGLPIKRMRDESLEILEKTWKSQNLYAKVQQAIFESPMPRQASEIIENKLKELLSSLDRVIGHLEVLAQKKSPLDELEIVEEIAYSYLFYDIHSILDKETEVNEKWKMFLQLAKKYRLYVF